MTLPPANAALLRALDARASDGDKRWEVTLDGRDLSFHSVTSTKTGPSGFRIETGAGPIGVPPSGEDDGHGAGSPYRDQPRPDAPNPAPLLVRFERARDRFGKRIGLNRETQLGDPELDARIYLECDAPYTATRHLFRHDKSRRELVRMLELGAPDVRLDREGQLSVTLRWRPEDVPTEAKFLEQVQAFADLADSFPTLRGHAPQLRSRMATALVVLSIGSSGLGLVALGLARWMYQPLDDRPYTVSLLVGVVVWVALLPVFFFVLRHRSTSLRDFVQTIVFSFFGVPLFCATLAFVVNGALDTSPLVRHSELVKRRWIIHDYSIGYHVQLEPVVPSDRGFELRVSRATYSAAAKGSVVVTTRGGALGWPWLVSPKP